MAWPCYYRLDWQGIWALEDIDRSCIVSKIQIEFHSLKFDRLTKHHFQGMEHNECPFWKSHETREIELFCNMYDNHTTEYGTTSRINNSL